MSFNDLSSRNSFEINPVQNGFIFKGTYSNNGTNFYYVFPTAAELGKFIKENLQIIGEKEDDRERK